MAVNTIVKRKRTKIHIGQEILHRKLKLTLPSIK
jgi:hypothetical protein